MFTRSFIQMPKLYKNNLRMMSLSKAKTKNIEFIPTVTQVITNKEAIDKDFGLKQFMNKTYLYTGGGILATMGTGIMFSQSPLMIEHLPLLFCGGFFTAMAGCFGLQFSKYKIHTTHIKDPISCKVLEAYHSKNSIERKISYCAIIGGMSLMMSPSIALANVIGILPPAMLATGSVFGGAMYYAKTKKVGELDALESALYGSLFGLIGCSLTGICSTMLFGPNIFSVFMHSIDLYAGIPLFAGFVAYDTHKAVDMYRKKDPDHLGCSVQLYLDFTNLLLRFIEIMASLKK